MLNLHVRFTNPAEVKVLAHEGASALVNLHAVDNLGLATRLAYPGSAQTIACMKAGGCA